MPGRRYRFQAAVLLLVCIVASLNRVLAFAFAPASSTALAFYATIQSQTRASKRPKTSTTRVAMALYQGKPGSSMIDAMSAAVAEGTLPPIDIVDLCTHRTLVRRD